MIECLMSPQRGSGKGVRRVMAVREVILEEDAVNHEMEGDIEVESVEEAVAPEMEMEMGMGMECRIVIDQHLQPQLDRVSVLDDIRLIPIHSIRTARKLMMLHYRDRMRVIWMNAVRRRKGMDIMDLRQ